MSDLMSLYPYRAKNRIITLDNKVYRVEIDLCNPIEENKIVVKIPSSAWKYR